MPAQHGLTCGFAVSPHHDIHVRSQRRLAPDKLVGQHFVPPYGLSAKELEKRGHTLDEKALKVIGRGQAELPGQVDAPRTFAPGLLTGFVAPDMDVVGREDVHDLAEDVAIEPVCLFVGRAHIALRALVSLTFQSGTGCRHLIAVARHLNLRDDGYALAGRIGHKLPELGLRVIAAVSPRSAFAHVLAVLAAVPPASPVALRAPGCLPGEFGVTPDLNAPSAGVGEMQLENVDFVTGEDVNLLL